MLVLRQASGEKSRTAAHDERPLQTPPPAAGLLRRVVHVSVWCSCSLAGAVDRGIRTAVSRA